MLAVHGGVGFKISSKASIWCADALKETNDISIAVKNLEDHPYFNCGVGSNLSSKETVECEAAYMASNNARFGAVGCVSRVKNPILVAREIALDIGLPGLIKPQVLVGQGAEQWAIEKGLEICDPEALITANSKRAWTNANKYWSEGASSNNFIQENTLDIMMDTVGGVSIKNGHCEACVSSGGIIYKRPGRLGHSTHIGAGTWAEVRGDLKISISASGCGEALVKTDFCRSLANAIFSRIPHDDLPGQIIDEWFRSEFLFSNYLADFSKNHILAGGIVMLQDHDCSEFLVFHNTPVFPFAYKSRGKVKHVISTLTAPSFVKVDSYLL